MSRAWHVNNQDNKRIAKSQKSREHDINTAAIYSVDFCKMLTPQGGVATHTRPRSRKSIAHMPSPDSGDLLIDKENMTVDTSVIAAKAASKMQKRSRSKSLGPGGLDALKEDAGNRRKVGDIKETKERRASIRP